MSFALLGPSQTSHLFLGILEIPIDHEQAFIILYKYFPSTHLSHPTLLETLLSEKLKEISLATSMLDLRKEIIKGFRSNKILFG